MSNREITKKKPIFTWVRRLRCGHSRFKKWDSPRLYIKIIYTVARYG